MQYGQYRSTRRQVQHHDENVHQTHIHRPISGIKFFFKIDL